MKKLLLMLFIATITISCTDNQIARNYGGTEEVKLPENHRFINLTWKQDNLWIVSQDTITKTYYMNEKSSFGVWEGKIVVKP